MLSSTITYVARAFDNGGNLSCEAYNIVSDSPRVDTIHLNILCMPHIQYFIGHWYISCHC